MPTSTASAVWEGGLRGGKGKFSAGSGAFAASETGSVERPIESPEIAFAASAMAPAATIPAIPSRTVSTFSLPLI